MEEKTYLFRSGRLGFRDWLDSDVEAMVEINADPEVMEYFPATQSPEKTIEFIERMRMQLADKGYCYFAVDRLDSGGFIGFIGLSEPRFEADFTPGVDIGWRLKRSEWGNGFATEGAKACLAYGFDGLGLEKIVAVAPCINVRSEEVMKKIGMRKVKEFMHPLLVGDERLERCVLYEAGSGMN